jgi:hypothetical protein
MKVQFKGKQEELFLKCNIFFFLGCHPHMWHPHSKRHKYLEVFGLFVSFAPGTDRPNHQPKRDLEHWGLLIYIFASMISSIVVIVMEAWCRFDTRKPTWSMEDYIVTSGNQAMCSRFFLLFCKWIPTQSWKRRGQHCLSVGPCPHRHRDYRIGSNFWKFYIIRTIFPLGEPVSLVKVFRVLVRTQ